VRGGNELPELCVSIDVERDYRLDGSLSLRGIEDGLPPFLDLLRSHGVPFDLFVSGEIADRLPHGLSNSTVAIGCHGMRHPPGFRSYLNRMTLEAQRNEISEATKRVRAAMGGPPVHFRAPNFSADAGTIAVLDQLGYRIDSSVLPGRHVKQWRLLPLLDHRGAPSSPYHPDIRSIGKRGGSRILEVPVSPNILSPGGPLGLGFLNASGAPDTVRAASLGGSRYLVFLAHTWEMIDWKDGDAVAPWVHRAASSRLDAMTQFLDHFRDSGYVNMDLILERETHSSRKA
jgi:peptidoglycan/xylan/chitin deacetylase (PgdA/CDA1 family)